MNEVEKLIVLRKKRLIGRLATKLLRLYGVEIPRSVIIGNNVRFPHNSFGTVIHDNTKIEDNVKIYQNVTLGRADIYNDVNGDFDGFEIKKNSILCAGAKLLGKKGKLVVGEGSVIAANAVLLNSTGDYEIWGGTC